MLALEDGPSEVRYAGSARINPHRTSQALDHAKRTQNSIEKGAPSRRAEIVVNSSCRGGKAGFDRPPESTASIASERENHGTSGVTRQPNMPTVCEVTEIRALHATKASLPATCLDHHRRCRQRRVVKNQKRIPAAIRERRKSVNRARSFRLRQQIYGSRSQLIRSFRPSISGHLIAREQEGRHGCREGMSCQKSILYIGDWNDMKPCDLVECVRYRTSTACGYDVDAPRVFLDRRQKCRPDVRILAARAEQPNAPSRQDRIKGKRHRSRHRGRRMEQPAAAGGEELGRNQGTSASYRSDGIFGRPLESFGKSAQIAVAHGRDSFRQPIQLR